MTAKKKIKPSREQNGYKCGIYIYRGLYDVAWRETNKKFPPPRNPDLPRHIQSWHHFYRTFLESLPILIKEEEVELINRSAGRGHSG